MIHFPIFDYKLSYHLYEQSCPIDKPSQPILNQFFIIDWPKDKEKGKGKGYNKCK